MPIKITTKPKAQINVAHINKGQVTDEHSTEEEVGVEINKTGPLATVGMETSVTINTGNYNSVKVGIVLHVPCEISEIEQVYEFIEGWINTKMTEATSEIAPGSD